LFLFTAAHIKTSEISNLNFNQAVFVANKSSLFFTYKGEKAFSWTFKQWHSRVPCFGGKNNFAHPSKKTVELRREKSTQKREKTKHLL